MGVSNRATRAIEPGVGDLLTPERNRKLHAARIRDVEDACFEAVSAPRDVFSKRPRTGVDSSVFKSRIAHPQADGPIPRDFAGKTMAQGERLGVFAGRQSAIATGGLRSPVSAFALAISAVVAVAVFWMAGGHALMMKLENEPQTLRVNAPLVSITDRAVLTPDPVVTSSIPVKKAKTTANGFTAPVPRPARIERAGSILMIRPAGD